MNRDVQNILKKNENRTKEEINLYAVMCKIEKTI